MSILLKVAVQGKLEDWARADANSIARVHTNLVRSAGSRTKKGIQKEIAKSFQSSRGFENAIKLVSNPPRGFSLNTSVRVYSKARYKASSGRRASAADLLEIYSRAESVTAAGKSWLAIPTEFAPLRGGRGGTRKAQPSEAGVKLTFVKKDANKAFLFHFPGGGVGVLMYVLVRQVTRRKRIDPDGIHRQTVAWSSEQLKRMFVREDQRIRGEFGVGMSAFEDL